jgi:uncharacterized damage-inducible protein DinB
MDEYARAAEDFCRTLQGLPPGAFDWTQASKDPDTLSVRNVCAHVCGAARGYANALRKARGLPHDEKRIPVDPASFHTADDVRQRLASALQYTEGALEGYYDADEATVMALRFEMAWGQTYDPEILLEHAIVHLLRHRRQLERWPRPAGSSPA